MIQLNKNYSLPEGLAESIPVKVVSVGGAGLNALDRIVLDGLEKASVVAISSNAIAGLLRYAPNLTCHVAVFFACFGSRFLIVGFPSWRR